MLHSPQDMAEILVTTYGNAPHHVLMSREVFEQHVDRQGVDHRLIRSVDLALRPLGYILTDLLQERDCVVLMRIEVVMHGEGTTTASHG